MPNRKPLSILVELDVLDLAVLVSSMQNSIEQFKYTKVSTSTIENTDKTFSKLEQAIADLKGK